MSHVTLLTGPERRRRSSEEDQCRIWPRHSPPGATVAAVARQYDVATSLIYKWRRTVRARATGFAEVVWFPISLSVPHNLRLDPVLDLPEAELCKQPALTCEQSPSIR